MNYRQAVSFCSERVVDVGTKVGAGIGFLAGAYLAFTDEYVRAEGSDSVGYCTAGGAVIGGCVGGIIGAVVSSGLESLTNRLYHAQKKA